MGQAVSLNLRDSGSSERFRLSAAQGIATIRNKFLP